MELAPRPDKSNSLGGIEIEFLRGREYGGPYGSELRDGGPYRARSRAVTNISSTVRNTVADEL